MPKYDVHAKQYFLMPNSTLKSQMSEICHLNNPTFLVQRKPLPSRATLSVSCRTKRHFSKTKRIETKWLIPDQQRTQADLVGGMRCRFAIQCFTGPYCVNQSLLHTYIYEETSLRLV